MSPGGGADEPFSILRRFLLIGRILSLPKEIWKEDELHSPRKIHSFCASMGVFVHPQGLCHAFISRPCTLNMMTAAQQQQHEDEQQHQAQGRLIIS